MCVLSIIVPAYNEINTINEILQKLELIRFDRFNKQMIIIDDCSTDGTREYLKALQRKRKDYLIIFHDINYGKGRAIRSGLKHVKGQYTIIQDADLEYNTKNISLLLNHAKKNKLDVVYGSRILNKTNKKHSHVFFYWGGLLVTLITNLLYGIKITDESTCYKLIKSDLLKSLDLLCEGFEFCPEVTSKIALKKIYIHEIPINYYPRKKEDGKKIKWIDGIKAIGTLIKWRISGFA